MSNAATAFSGWDEYVARNVNCKLIRGEMRTKRKLDLSSFDGELLDGLEFCRRVYLLFDQVHLGTDGVARLRLRPTKLEKRLVEELIPLARYVQLHYGVGRRIKVRWCAGSQSYDAVLWSSGLCVKRGAAPRKLTIEITTSVHVNEHLARRLLQERGGSFGPKGITRDAKTGAIVSRPYVYENNEFVTEFADQIIARLRSKGQKKYPPSTVLIVNCVPTAPVLQTEWAKVGEQVSTAGLHSGFREVFLLESFTSRDVTLYGNPKTRRRT